MVINYIGNTFNHVKHINMIKTIQENGTKSNVAEILPSQWGIPQG